MNIPITKDTVFLQSLKTRAKYTSFGDAHFWVVNYTIRAGRKVKEASFGATPRGSTIGTGNASGMRAAEALTVQNPSVAPDKQETYQKAIKAHRGFSLDGSSAKLPIGENVIPIDLNANVYKITMRVYFINTNDNGKFISYIEHRDKFQRYVQDPNPKMLHLPTYKPFLAIPSTCKTIFDSKKNGYEMADVIFYRASVDVNLKDRSETDAFILNLTTKCMVDLTEVLSAVQDGVLSDMKNEAGTVASTTMDALAGTQKKSLLDSIQGITATVSSKITGLSNSVSAVIAKASAISGDIVDLVMLPVQLMGELSSLYDDMISVIANPIEAVNYFVVKAKVFIEDLKDSTMRIPNAVTQLAVNLGLYSSSVHVAHAVMSFNAIATCTLDVEFTSAQEALDARDTISELYDELSEVISQHTEYAGFQTNLNEVYSSITSYLVTLQAKLPQVRTIETANNTSLIVTTYDIYGDATRERDVLNRNNLKSAYHLPSTLEVIVDNED